MATVLSPGIKPFSISSFYSVVKNIAFKENANAGFRVGARNDDRGKPQISAFLCVLRVLCV